MILSNTLEIVGDNMIRIRPFKASDTNTVLSWCQDEKAFYQWTAGIIGPYPPSEAQFAKLNRLMQFTALDEKEIVGFFTMRNPGDTLDELRFGFVIVDPRKRGKGCGKAMLQLGIKYAFEIYRAQRVSLGVFENNPSAYYCYKAAGFKDVVTDTAETYSILGEEWKCKELMLEST